MVDEYQDTNHSQYLIVRALADKFQNICVVGDDAQSIYAFRGANISNILNFQKDYDDVKEFRLEQNYRSTKNIVNAANSVIDKNKTKLEKVVWTANDEGAKVKVHRSLTDGDEGRFVASTIWETKMNDQFKIVILLFYIVPMHNRVLLKMLYVNVIFRTEFMADYHFTNVKKLKMYYLICV